MNARKPVDGFAASLMIILCAIWGTQQVAIKMVASDMSPLLQAGLRSGLAALIILPLIFRRREQWALGDGMWRPGLAVGALFGLEFVFVGEGLRFTNASHMAIFLYTAPIFAAIGLHIKNPEERLKPLQWAGVVLAFGGVAISFAGGGEAAGPDAWIGDLFGLAAGAFWGATTVVLRGSRLSDAPATVTLVYQLTGAFILATGAAMLFGQTSIRVTPELLGSLAYQVVIISVVSFLAWFSLLRTYLASRLGVLTFMTPVFGVLFGMAILGERLDAGFILGAFLILGGIVLVSASDFLPRLKAGRRPAGT